MDGKTMRGLIAILVWLVGCLLLPGAVQATENKVDPAEIEKLLTVLKDDGQRAKLVEQLTGLVNAQRVVQADAEPETAAGMVGDFLTRVSKTIATTSTQISSVAEVLRDVDGAGAWLQSTASNPEILSRWGWLLAKVLLVLAAAALIEQITDRLLTGVKTRIDGRDSDAALIRWTLLIARFAVDLLPIAAFAAAAYLLLPLSEPDRTTRLVTLALANAHVVARGLMAVARLVTAPESTRRRPWGISDETAAYLYLWLRRLVLVAVYGGILLEAALLLGMPDSLYNILLRLLGLIFALLLVVLTLQNQTMVADWLRSTRRKADDDAPEPRLGRSVALFRRRLAEIWHVLAILYIAGGFVVWALEIPGGLHYMLRASALTILVLILSSIAARGLERALTAGFSVSADIAARFPGLEARANRYLPVMRMVLRGALWLITGVLLLQSWGLDSFAWLASPLGRRLTSSAVSILLVIATAVLFWEILSSAIERYLADQDGKAGQGSRAGRARTLLPLARNAIMIVLIVVVSLIVLSELGLNIAPLLAGAGVVGLAVSFGAQSLVKDIITGLFILVEDTINVGDTIEVDGRAGTVESITIRTLRIRDLSGAVHTVPFSAVGTVKNMSKGFSYALFDVNLEYSASVGDASQVLRDVDSELRQNPALAPALLEPLEVMGLQRFADSAVILRARIKTAPGRQWEIERAFNAKLKEAFDKNGFSFPYPHQVVKVSK